MLLLTHSVQQYNQFNDKLQAAYIQNYKHLTFVSTVLWNHGPQASLCILVKGIIMYFGQIVDLYEW